MKWFANLSIKTKLFLSFSIFLIILCFVILQSIKSMNFLSEINMQLYNNQFKLVDDVPKIRFYNNNIHMSLLSMVASTDKADRDKWLEHMKQMNEERNQKITEVSEIEKNNPNFSFNIKELKKYIKESEKLINDNIFPNINSGNMDLAKKYVMQDHLQNLNAMSSIVDEMVKDANLIAETSIATVKKEVANIVTLFLILGLGSLIMMFIIVLLINKSISEPINELSVVSKKIAHGELKIPILTSSERTDEIGVLSNSFKIMVMNLHKLTQEINEVINFLTNSSSEISSASVELSSASSETATSISETTSTIEEVKQTSQVANKKAHLMSDAAKKTSEMSEAGKRAATELNESINEIRAQMGLIAETMMRLNEQNQAIGTIITSVEDLAQQTNLLAVNASIEASKAGEQGKGFSVVAQEVKSLANQSKQATNQVRSILLDVQKATSAAVMATELGSKSVENGAKKTNEAGSAIFTLMQTITDNTQAATQIAAVSQQQLVGMEQATIAMENIKQASNQNVESAKLLRDSVVNIKDLSDKLKKLMDQFIIE